jgi:hypothetical protein
VPHATYGTAGSARAERESVDSAMRQVAFLGTAIAELERLIARAALASPQIRRLMTVPGVNVIVAASFPAANRRTARRRDHRRARPPHDRAGWTSACAASASESCGGARAPGVTHAGLKSWRRRFESECRH